MTESGEDWTMISKEAAGGSNINSTVEGGEPQQVRPLVQWEFQRSNGQFVPLEASDKIEKAYQRSKESSATSSTVEYEAKNGQRYSLDFDTLIQTNMGRHCKRCVRRRTVVVESTQQVE